MTLAAAALIPAAGMTPDIGNVDPGVLQVFERIQKRFGRDIPINSGYRSPKRNFAAGGAKRSQHMEGKALDLNVSDLSKRDRLRLMQIASEEGITGIGVYDNALHFDTGPRRAWGPSHGKESIPGWAKKTIGGHLHQRFQVAGGGGSDTLAGGAEADKLQALRDRVNKQYGANEGQSEAAKIKALRDRVSQQYGMDKPAKEESSIWAPDTTLGKIGGAINTAIEGATGGLVGDEADAFMGAVFGGTPEQSFWEEYDANLAKRRASEDAFREENPGLAIGSEIGGAVAGALALAPLAGAGAASTGGKVARAAGTGAASAGLIGFTEGEGGLANRATDAAINAPVGAALGVVGREVAVAAGRVLGPLVRRGQAFVNGQLTNQGRRALEAAGIDPNQITTELIRNFEARARRSGVSPETAARAEADEFNIPLSRGQATGNFDDIAFEEAARTGARGEGAGAIARGFQEQQDEAIQTALDEIVGGASSSPRAAGEAVGGFVREAEEAARNASRAAYDAIPDGAMVVPDALDALQLGAREALDEVAFANPTSHAQFAIEQLDRLGERTFEVDGVVGVNFKAVEKARQAILKRQRQVRGKDDVAADEIGEIIGAFDEWIDDTVARSLMFGDDGAIEAVRNARAMHRSFKQLFSKQNGRHSDDAGRLLEKIIQPDTTPEEVARFLYGVSKIGAQGSSVRLTRRIQRIFGGIPQELRRGAWMAVVKGGDDAKTRPGAQQISERILDFVSGSGESLSRALFSEAERGQMRRLAIVLKRTVPPKGATNPSGTGAAIARSVQDAWNALLPVVGIATGNPVTGFGLRLAEGMARSQGGRSAARRSFNPAPARPRSGREGAVGGGSAAGQGVEALRGPRERQQGPR